MKLSPDDPKLTAYALGELDAAERAAVEAVLAGSPEARAAVEEIRAAAGRLTSELAAEACPELTPAQRAALASPATAKVVPFPSWRVWRTAGIAAAAACVIGLAGWALFGPAPDKRHAKSESQSQNSNRAPLAHTHSVTPHTEPKVLTGNAVPATNAVVSSDLQVRSTTLAQDGKLFIEAGRFELAEARLAEALRLDPSNDIAERYLKLCKDVIDRAQQGTRVEASQSPHARVILRARGKVSQKLDSVRLSELRFDSLPLAQVVDWLKSQAKAADPEGKGVNFIVSTSADTGGGVNSDITAVTIRVDPALNDITLHEALEIIVKVADRPICYSVEPYGVLFSPRTPEVAELHTRWYKLGDGAAFLQSLQGVTALDQVNTGLPVTRGYGRSRGGGGFGGSGFGGSQSGFGSVSSAEYAGVTIAPGGGRRGGFGQGGVNQSTTGQARTPGQGGGGQGGVDFVTVPTTTDLVSSTIRTYFQTAGVTLDPPKSMVFNDRLGMLMVRATAADLDLIEQAVQVLDRVHTPIAAYSGFLENIFVPVLQEPLSTFSIDVDTASYANVRRFLNSGQLPPCNAVRIEELVNYFTYAYAAPKGGDPFSASIETAGCPWAPAHRLVRVALRGRELPRGKRPPSNFVFLIDVSGSMQPPERLPLLKQALRALVKKMTESDRVAIVVYATEAGVKLESTSCAEKEKILAIIDALEAGGSTNGGEGIQQAYTMARKHFIQGGANRVLLCTDGDFNVGLTDQNALVALVKENAASGVFLTTLGVGTDNYKDALMQRLSDRGNGNYHYLDTLEEANKVLGEQMNANLVTIAKDVKIQVEFNPAQVSAYRLIGYEKRVLRAQDFNNDRKDAGEIGAGHTVTAFYEIVPAGKAAVQPVVDRLKYQSAVAPASYSEKGEQSKELLTLKLRYKQPDGDTSKLIEFPHTDSGSSYGKASADFKFAASVASFGMLLRGSEHTGRATFDTVLELAEQGKGADDGGWRAEFINLVKKAKGLRD